MTVPDFIIIGAMKCGTTTLHDQLAAQAQFFMSQPKEPNFFSDDQVYAKGIEWYENLFATADGKAIKGESSTHYTKLPTNPRTIDRLAKTVPGAKFVYVMRHPLDRLISHYIHEWTEKKVSSSIDQAIHKHSSLIDYSRYAYQLKPWIDRFGHDQILPVFFERMTAAPQDTLERVAKFVGATESVSWKTNIDASNISSERIRRFPLYGLFVENTLATAIRRRLVPQTIRNIVKSNTQMKKRPTLSESNLAHLTSVFDDDLKTLGQMLGVTLTCANFKERVQEQPINWPSLSSSVVSPAAHAKHRGDQAEEGC